MRLVLCAVLTSGVLSGCMTSKWAMDDADYAQKYDEPYPDDKTEKIGRIAKQMVDARHVAGKSGVYLGGAGQNDPPAAGGEIGLFHYGPPWFSGRIGLAILGGTDSEDVFTGLDMGLRVQSPSRIALFAGLGLFAGYSKEEVYDRNCDCSDDTIDGAFFAVYPEVGVHFWLSARTRITASARYLVNSDGRDHDFAMFGLSVAGLSSD